MTTRHRRLRRPPRLSFPADWEHPLALASDATVNAIGDQLLATRPVQIDPQNASLRTMGVRFVLDSWVYDQLSAPNVTNRGTVSPLDFAAVMGSDWALARQIEAGVASTYPGYAPTVASLRAQVGRAIRRRGPPPSTTPGSTVSPLFGNPTAMNSRRT